MNRTVILFASLTFTGAFLVNAIQTCHASSQAVSPKLNANAKMIANSKRVQSHRLVVQVDVDDPAIMNLALNNISNTVQHYSEIGQKVEVEMVAFGPGLHMLRDDTSPVKARIKSMSETMPEVAFSACGNTKENMAKTEAKEIPFIAQAKVTKSGVVRLMELQQQGWNYLRP
jgi:intracellular sulfur oxidation DsrE/DsrF family protein